jgi:hypothetical protein
MSVLEVLIAKRAELEKQIIFTMRHEHLHDLCELRDLVSNNSGKNPITAAINAMVERVNG